MNNVVNNEIKICFENDDLRFIFGDDGNLYINLNDRFFFHYRKIKYL